MASGWIAQGPCPDASIAHVSYDEDSTGHCTAGMYGDSYESWDGTPVKELFDQFIEENVFDAKDRDVFLMCGSGTRAGYTKDALEGLGYEAVYNVGNGVPGCFFAGRRIETYTMRYE